MTNSTNNLKLTIDSYLKILGITFTKLAQDVNIPRASLHKSLSAETISFKRLLIILDVLNIDLVEFSETYAPFPRFS